MDSTQYETNHLRQARPVNGKTGYPLTDTERLWILCPCISSMLTVRVRGDVSEARLVGALRKIQESRPILAMHVEVDDAKEMYWVPQDTLAIPLARLEKRSSTHWQDLLLPGQSVPFLFDNRPLLRVTWLYSERSSDLILDFHHAIADGISCMLVARELLRFLVDDAAQPVPHPLVYTKDLAVIPGEASSVSEEMLRRIDSDNSWWEQNGLPLTKSDLVNSRSIPHDMHRFRYRFCALCETATQTAITNARKNDISLNSLLIAAFQKASHALYPKHSVSTQRLEKVLMPISARQFYTVPVDECFGVYNASVALEVKHDAASSLMDGARRLHATIKETFAEAYPHLFTTERLYKRMNRDMLDATMMRMFFKDLPFDVDSHSNLYRVCCMKSRNHTDSEPEAPSDLEWGMALSNIGVFRCEDERSLQLLEEVFTSQRVPPNCEKMVSVVTAAGKLNIALCYDTNVLPDDLVAEICSLVEADLTLKV